MNFVEQVFTVLLLPPLTALACSALATGWLARWLRQKQVMDIPNHRSNHSIPTPRGGGLAVVGSVLLLWLLVPLAYGWLEQDLLPENLHPMMLAAVGLMWISWLDDRGGLPASIRLLAQMVAVAAGIAGFSGAIWAPAEWGVPLWLDHLVAAVFWLWFINLFNFMDGIDGISGTETICITLLLWFLVMNSSMDRAWLLYLSILGASAGGFLLWNWHPARIFLGDVGSIPLGFLLGWLLLEVAQAGFWAVALVAPAYYLVDSSLTLIRRVLAGHSPTAPHSEHAYQKAVRLKGWSPRRVCLLLLLVNGANSWLVLTLAQYGEEVLAVALAYVCALCCYFFLSHATKP